MVCVPCLFVPFFLWIFHKFILPLLLPLFPSLQEKFGNRPAIEANDINIPAESALKSPEPVKTTGEVKKDL
ncbi:unnamed protein product [Hymenolepis diminuta]|uniref:Uncharacterized protein n=1 Tax=Hymenolepis diminuta TaxID=6216 RepID=A0A564Y3R7_HYMDI|nr:unnamed protein product [Hymenolepis diminuta]